MGMPKRSKNIIIIMPARGGSKRLKNKNILPINKKPMFVYTMLQAMRSKKIKKFFVSTENKKIISICKKYNINYIIRPKHLSKDNVEKQEAIIHAVRQLVKKKYYPNTIISLQPNSPETKAKDIDKALTFFEKKLYPNNKIKELISVGKNNIQNAAFRIMTYDAVFQKTLSTKIGIFFTNALDIHNKKEYLKIKKKLENA